MCVYQLRKKTLEVSVWDYDKGSSNDFLGEVNLFENTIFSLVYLYIIMHRPVNLLLLLLRSS